jgi:transposase
VVYDFCESALASMPERFLGDWKGSLICDDFAGYKALIARGVTEVGCLAHARRKFFDLHAANKSQIAEFACSSCQGLRHRARGQGAETPISAKPFGSSTPPILDALHSG